MSDYETGPTDTYDTGILDLSRKLRSASREPRVDAATPTPCFYSLTFFLTVSKSFLARSIARSSSS